MIMEKIHIEWGNTVTDDWQSKNSVGCYASTKLLRAGKRSKKIYTSLGLIDLEWSRLRCKNCRKIYDPLKAFFYLETNQTKSSSDKNLFRVGIIQYRIHSELKFRGADDGYLHHDSLNRLYLRYYSTKQRDFDSIV